MIYCTLLASENMSRNTEAETSGCGLNISCQDVNFRDIQDIIELYKLSYWFARTKHNIP